ncbi:hypothetical protein AU476_09580 [Cupriavidus sp. UYMSc13B]|nr:hypothetical protein AU476_09580 [Cupriavidus sp. UYMSc13B]
MHLQYPSTDMIETDADNALQKIGLRYRRVGRPHGTTFEIYGAIDDGQFASLQKLFSLFNRKWGTRPVDFKIAMQTDTLKGKSYWEGKDGYVLLNRVSWYFPQPLNGHS